MLYSPMEFTTIRYADISTEYLEQKDLELLLREDAPCHWANEDGLTASIFYVYVDDGGLQDFKEFGFSERFIDIMRELKRQGIQYVNFDSFGAPVRGLEPTCQ